jgi:hypothetical protein
MQLPHHRVGGLDVLAGSIGVEFAAAAPTTLERFLASSTTIQRLLDHADAAARFVGAACVDTTVIALWLGIGEALEILTAMWLAQIGRPMRGPDSSFFP